MIIVINPREKQFTDFVKSTPSRFGREGATIYKQRNEIRVFDAGGMLLNVKKFKTPSFFNRVIYTFFRPSKAERSFKYAIRLREQSISTPEPIAYILTKRRGLLYESYFISKQLHDYRTFYEFGKGGIAGREHILSAFAVFTAELHEKGIYHKDYSPGNILFREAKGEEIEFSIVDINRMRFGKVSISKGCANFARLWGQAPLFRFVAEKYATERRVDPEICVKQVLKVRTRFWRKYTKKYPLPFAPDEALADGDTIT
jgi:serine/threonine protein kinase